MEIKVPEEHEDQRDQDEQREGERGVDEVDGGEEVHAERGWRRPPAERGRKRERP